MKLTHIVPRFWPQIDGLGDYARLLGQNLERDHGIQSRFVVGDPAWSASDDAGVPGAATVEAAAVVRRTARDLLVQLDGADAMMLHYVGYGYQRRGVPFWINRAMRDWRRGAASRRLVVVFHELWASGPPWKSECYLGVVQKYLVRELHRLAHASIASVPLALRRLNAIQPGKTILHPIPSGISTAFAEGRAWHRGGPVKLALFGMPAQREESLRRHVRLVTALDAAGLLECVTVVGKGARAGDNPSRDVGLLREKIANEKIRIVPDASPEDAGKALAASDMMLSFYPSRWFCKSSSAMAALGNGTIPILPEADDLEIVQAGSEVLVCDGETESVAAMVRRVRENAIGSVQQAGRAWYVANADWPILTSKVWEMLNALQRPFQADGQGTRLAELCGRYQFFIGG